ncbi:hypothetical protein TorRG33x02_063020, partial [Trema orientale]
MAAEGEIPIVVDVQSRRRKSIFRIVRSSLVWNQESAQHRIIQCAPENRREGSIV